MTPIETLDSVGIQVFSPDGKLIAGGVPPTKGSFHGQIVSVSVGGFFIQPRVGDVYSDMSDGTIRHWNGARWVIRSARIRRGLPNFGGAITWTMGETASPNVA